jgi:hypothetical protein
MSTTPRAVPLTEFPVPNFVADLAFNTSTLISTSNGDCLDFLPPEEGSPATSPLGLCLAKNAIRTKGSLSLNAPERLRKSSSDG